MALLLESGDAILLENGDALLEESAGVTPFDPATSTFSEQHADFAGRVTPRCVALMLTACVLGAPPIAQPFDPASFPHEQSVDFPRREKLRATGLRDQACWHVRKPGVTGQALRIDRIANALELVVLPNPVGVTFTGWARLRVDRNDYSPLFSLETPAGHSLEWTELITDSDGTTLKVFDHVVGAVTVGTMVRDQWFRVAMVVKSGSVDAYFGAEGRAALALASGSIVNVVDVQKSGIGATTAAATEWWNGNVSLYRVWNAELTQAEIERELQSPTPLRTTGLLGSWLPLGVTTPTLFTAQYGADIQQPAGIGTAVYSYEKGPELYPFDPGVEGFPWEQPSEPQRRAAPSPEGQAAFVPVLAAPAFNPANGFPWEQSENPQRAAPRTEGQTAFVQLVAAPAFNPGDGFPWEQGPEPVRPAAPRGEGQVVLASPFDPRFGFPWAQCTDQFRARVGPAPHDAAVLATPFNPRFGFPWEQPVEVPNAARRTTSHVASVLASPFDPRFGFPWSQTTEVLRSAPRTTQHDAAVEGLPYEARLFPATEFPDFARGPQRTTAHTATVLASPFDPRFGFPWEQPAEVPRSARRTTTHAAAVLAEPYNARFFPASEFPDFARAAQRVPNFDFTAAPVLVFNTFEFPWEQGSEPLRIASTHFLTTGAVRPLFVTPTAAVFLTGSLFWGPVG